MVHWAELSVTTQSRNETKLVDAQIETAKSGQAIAGLLMVICVIASITFFAFGNRTAGVALLSYPLIQLVNVLAGTISDPTRSAPPPPPPPASQPELPF